MSENKDKEFPKDTFVTQYASGTYLVATLSKLEEKRELDPIQFSATLIVSLIHQNLTKCVTRDPNWPVSSDFYRLYSVELS